MMKTTVFGKTPLLLALLVGIVLALSVKAFVQPAVVSQRSCQTAAVPLFEAADSVDGDSLEEKGDKGDTFRKAEFIAAVALKTGMNKKDSETALKAVLDVVQEQVGSGKRVNLAGFGTFTLKQRAARKGRNPQTGEELQIAASKSPGFSPAKAWKDAVNNRTPAAAAVATPVKE